MSTIIHAISGPRNISTALMYSFAQRSGCAVFDEPMYGRFLETHGHNHPGRREVLEQWPRDLATVAREVEQRAANHPEVYLKNMAHHIVGEPWEWAQSSAFVFWIRHPRKVVESFAKVVQEVRLEDIGIRQQHRQWSEIQQLGVPKVIVDSDEMLAAPERTLPVICAALGLPWDSQMLEWPAGPKPYDGPWAPHWYHNVHQTTGFGAPKPLGPPLAPPLERVVQEALAYYNDLFQLRLQF